MSKGGWFSDQGPRDEDIVPLMDPQFYPIMLDLSLAFRAFCNCQHPPPPTQSLSAHGQYGSFSLKVP